MRTQLSRSEQKRQAKGVEVLVHELVDLSKRAITLLPCDDFFKQEITQASILKGSSKKRQIKYIAKGLRKEPETVEELLDYMQQKKGSQLKQNREFHEVERLRDALINSVVALHEDAMSQHQLLDVTELSRLHIPALEEIIDELPELDKNVLLTAAWQYVRRRKPSFSREIFRMIKAAREKQQFVMKANRT